MPPYWRTGMFFATSVLIALLAASILSVYSFDAYEPAWGRGGSLQITFGIAISASGVSLFGAAFGARLAEPRRPVSPAIAAASGVGFGVLTIVGALLIKTPLTPWVSLLWFVLAPAMACFALGHFLGKEPGL